MGSPSSLCATKQNPVHVQALLTFTLTCRDRFLLWLRLCFTVIKCSLSPVFSERWRREIWAHRGSLCQRQCEAEEAEGPARLSCGFSLSELQKGSDSEDTPFNSHCLQGLSSALVFHCLALCSIDLTSSVRKVEEARTIRSCSETATIGNLHALARVMFLLVGCDVFTRNPSHSWAVFGWLCYSQGSGHLSVSRACPRVYLHTANLM